MSRPFGGGPGGAALLRAEDAKFTSRFITASDNIKSFADLKGKTFAFGAPSSTSGHLMPRYFLPPETSPEFLLLLGRATVENLAMLLMAVDGVSAWLRRASA